MTEDTRPRGAELTRERILDAAERLFARSGFDGVSLRQITREAGVELALANYHFGPKAALYRAVVRRRSAELNAERLALLEALPAGAPIEDLVDAFSRPFLERSLHGGPGWKDYARVVAQMADAPGRTAELMSEEFDPVARAFIDRVRATYPAAAPERVYWGFHFLVGAMTITFADTGRIDVLSAGLCRSDDLAAIHAHMVPFLAAGFARLCGTPA